MPVSRGGVVAFGAGELEEGGEGANEADEEVDDGVGDIDEAGREEVELPGTVGLVDVAPSGAASGKVTCTQPLRIKVAAATKPPRRMG